jgi:hypothetical protein
MHNFNNFYLGIIQLYFMPQLDRCIVVQGQIWH